MLLIVELFSNINIVTLIWNQLMIGKKVLLEFVNDKNDTIGISNQYSATIITNHAGVYYSEVSDTYRKTIDVHRSLTAMTSHHKTLNITGDMIEVSNSDIIDRSNYNNNCETRKCNSNINVNILSGNNNNSNAALNLSIIVGTNSILVNDICTNIKRASNNVQGFKTLKPGRSIMVENSKSRIDNG